MGESISIAFTEEDASPNEEMGHDGKECSTVLRCAWDDRWDLIDQLLLPTGFPYPHVAEPGVGEDDNRPRALSASAKRAPGKNLGTGSWNSYAQALITVKYGVQDLTAFDEGTQDIFAESIEPSAEFQNLPHKLFEWHIEQQGADPIIIPIKAAEAPGFQVRGFDYLLTRYRLTTLPTGLLTLIGTTNKTAMTASTLGLTFAAETLLFNPPTISRTMSTSGTTGWTVNYRFSYRANTWNKYWNGEYMEWATMYLQESGVEYKSYEPEEWAGQI
jgi:hypothetical protein